MIDFRNLKSAKVILRNSGVYLIDCKIFRTELDRRKVAVFNAASGSWSAIPIALTPTTVEAAEWDSLVRDGRLIFGAFLKLLRWLQCPAQDLLAKNLFYGLSDFEREFVTSESSEYWGHVTIRMDLFWHHGKIKIIEVNCTIPAMQAYSDNVFNAWELAGGEAQGESKNSQQLLESLIAMYRLDGGRLARPRIVILHREGDSQMGELLWFQKEWTALGFETFLADPTRIFRIGDVWMVDEVPCDLVYRHIFAFRLNGHEAGQQIKKNRSCHIYNPVSAHFEAKAFLALVSQVAGDQKLASEVNMTEEEISAIGNRVPQSRILGRDFSGSSLGMSGRDARDRIGMNLSSIVLKRSVGYGGNQVIMGDSWATEETQTSLREMTTIAGEMTFEKFYDWVSNQDDSLWIVQERLSGARRKTQVLTNHGLEVWDAFFDASIFINSRTAPICRGGVSRISTSPIVNIGKGGGLAPFLIVTNAI
jgi:hypothetical protein